MPSSEIKITNGKINDLTKEARSFFLKIFEVYPDFETMLRLFHYQNGTVPVVTVESPSGDKSRNLELFWDKDAGGMIGFGNTHLHVSDLSVSDDNEENFEEVFRIVSGILSDKIFLARKKDANLETDYDGIYDPRWPTNEKLEGLPLLSWSGKNDRA